MRKKISSIIVFLLFVGTVIAIFPISGDVGRSSTTPDTEPNNSFAQATSFTSNDTIVNGHVSLPSPSDTVDYFKFDSVPAGKIINASVKILSPTTAKLELYMYNKYKEDGMVAWSISSRFGYAEWEACAALAVTTGTYYVKVLGTKNATDYVLHAEYKDAEFIDLADVSMDNPKTISGRVSNNTSIPNKWYRVKLDAGTDKIEILTVNMTEVPGARTFDLYFMDLYPNSMAWWYNFSWWGDNVIPYEEVSAASTYDTRGNERYYYVWVNAYNGSGEFILTIKKNTLIGTHYQNHVNKYDTAVVDGVTTPQYDSGPEYARLVSPQGVKDVVKYRDCYIDMALDHYDWYKVVITQEDFDKVPENGTIINATMNIDTGATIGIYRLTIYKENTTTTPPTYEVMSSSTTYRQRDPNNPDSPWEYFYNVNAFTTKRNPLATPGTYYVVPMAQIALNPKNLTNTWDRNIMGAYDLDIIVPSKNNPPYVRNPPPSVITIDEDKNDTSLKLFGKDGIFYDNDTETLGDVLMLDKTIGGTGIVTDKAGVVDVSVGDDTNGSITLTPHKNWYGNVNITFHIKDNGTRPLKAHAGFMLSVQPVNDWPEVVGSLPDFFVPVGKRNDTIDKWEPKLSLNLVFKDPDNDKLRFEVKDNGSIPVVIEANGEITYGEPTKVGVYTLKFYAYDTWDPPGSASTTQKITVVPVPTEPQINESISKRIKIKEDSGETRIPLAQYFYDEDNDIVSYICGTAKTSSNLEAKIDTMKNELVLKPKPNYYTHLTDELADAAPDDDVKIEKYGIKAIDAGGRSNETTLFIFVINVNDAPTIEKVSPDNKLDPLIKIEI
ncbi:MAG: hypothetical protein AB1779_06690, partial [Candidatus Thermoplasmatota archaeon]